MSDFQITRQMIENRARQMARTENEQTEGFEGGDEGWQTFFGEARDELTAEVPAPGQTVVIGPKATAVIRSTFDAVVRNVATDELTGSWGIWTVDGEFFPASRVSIPQE